MRCSREGGGGGRRGEGKRNSTQRQQSNLPSNTAAAPSSRCAAPRNIAAYCRIIRSSVCSRGSGLDHLKTFFKTCSTSCVALHLAISGDLHQQTLRLLCRSFREGCNKCSPNISLSLELLSKRHGSIRNLLQKHVRRA